MGPCEWEVTPTCPGWSQYTAEQQADAIAMATLVLWAATGRRYGRCEVTVRPCNPGPGVPLYVDYPAVSDALAGGSGPVAEGAGWNRCGPGCRCSSRCEVELDGPVTTDAIVQVTVNGGVVAGPSYEVHDGHLLVRTDGLCWPTCTDPSTDDFEVTYLQGLKVPEAVSGAAGLLACEFAQATTAGECRLPARLSSLSRQGVEVQVAEVTDGSDLFVTGIVEVDRVIAAVNPHRRAAPPLVLSPDMPTARRVT